MKSVRVVIQSQRKVSNRLGARMNYGCADLFEFEGGMKSV